MKHQFQVGDRFRFRADTRNLGNYANCYARITRPLNESNEDWWFEMEDSEHPESRVERHVHEKWMIPAPLAAPPVFTSIEEADAWLEAHAR